MIQLRQDTLFWTREGYESVARQKGHKGTGGPDTPPRNAKAKGRHSDWPANWAKVSPKGVQYCRDHFLKKKCPGNCGRSHNCPVLKNGWVCNAAPSEHSPEQCPHRWLLVEPVASGTELPAGSTWETPPSKPITTLTAEGLPSHGSHNATIPHSQSKAAGRIPPTTPGVDGQTLLGLCPWLSSFPHRLLERLTWTTQPTAVLQGRDILLLYAGPKDGGALDDILTQQQQDLGRRLIAVDIQRPHEEGPNDILEDGFYSTLCCAAAEGQLTFVGGGQNCRTWSILRWFPKPGAPRPVRGRDPSQTWGLETNSLEEQLDTDKDSLLLLRQMVITALAPRARKPSEFHSFLEHPRDPIECSRAPADSRCSSIWATRVYREWAKEVNHHRIHFDQCRLGQVARKSTTFSTDLPLHHWQGLQCNHGEHTRSPTMTSSDLSRYPPTLMTGLAAAIIRSLPDKGPPRDGMPADRRTPR